MLSCQGLPRIQCHTGWLSRLTAYAGNPSSGLQDAYGFRQSFSAVCSNYCCQQSYVSAYAAPLQVFPETGGSISACPHIFRYCPYTVRLIYNRCRWHCLTFLIPTQYSGHTRTVRIHNTFRLIPVIPLLISVPSPHPAVCEFLLSPTPQGRKPRLLKSREECPI